MGPLFLLVGLVFFLLPPVFVRWAWKSFRKEPKPLVAWRSSGFSWALVGASINCALSVLFFLVHKVVLPQMIDAAHGVFISHSIFQVERVFEWSAAIFSAVFFVLAFFGAGKARIYVALACFFNFYLWAATL